MSLLGYRVGGDRFPIPSWGQRHVGLPFKAEDLENLVLMLSVGLTMKKGERQCNASWFCRHFGRENKR